MLLKDVLQQAGANPDDASTWNAVSPFWETSVLTLPTGPLSFLAEPFVTEYYRRSLLPEEHLPLILSHARQVEDNPALRLLLWHTYQRLVTYEEYGAFADWPTMDACLNGHGEVFYLLAALATMPHAEKALRRQLVPDEVVADTLRVLTSISQRVRINPNAFGIPRGALAWLRHHINGRIFRIGRMEWLRGRFGGPVHVFSHHETGEVRFLMVGDKRMTPRGIHVWGEVDETDGCWTTTFSSNEQEVTGNPVNIREGLAEQRLLTLSRSEWAHRFSPGMPMLDMHIPAGGGMTPEACKESFLGAVKFFDTHFPSFRYAALVCRSWILNPDLQQILPSDANLVKLQRAVRLYPALSTPTDSLRFLFGEDKLPERLHEGATSLHRAVYDFLKAGNRWRTAGMVLLKDEVDSVFEKLPS